MPVDLARLRSLATDLQVRQARSLARPRRDIAVVWLSSGVLLDKYNPAQPRDPHTGEWGFSDGAWIGETLHFAAGALQVGAGEDNTTTLGFDVPGRTRASVTLGFSLGEQLREIFDQAADGTGWKVGRERSVARYNGGKGYATNFVGVTRTDDGYRMELATGTGGSPPETAGELDLTPGEVARLIGAMGRMSAAAKVETDAGRMVSLMEGDGGDISVHLPASGGKPIDLTANFEQGWTLRDAINTEISNIDEYPVDGDGNARYGPDDMVHRSAVELDRTEIYISSYGQYDNGGYLVAESSAHDWYLKLPAGQFEDIGEALGGTADTAEMLRDQS